MFDIVPRENLIFLSGDEDSEQGTAGRSRSGVNLEGELEGMYTTPEGVLSRLPTASVLHLACHGDQLPSNPLQSGFIMRDGERLTVEMLMRQQQQQQHIQKNASVAVLSACHTAGNDAESPDEAINLAGVMLFVGFSSVAATMWCVLLSILRFFLFPSFFLSFTHPRASED